MIRGVLPGTYEAVVQRWLGGYYEEAEFEDLTARVTITVAADETTSVTLDL